MGVVDGLSMATHFIALSYPYIAEDVAHLFLDNIFKLHKLPTSTVSDRDQIFVSIFSEELFQLQGVSLHSFSAYHPQIDGQIEVVNRCMETYLRGMCSEKLHTWPKWLSLAKRWCNANYHTTLEYNSYEQLYGRPPLIHLPYLPSESKILLIDRSL